MYRRRQRHSINLLGLILIGFGAGLVFLFYDSWNSARQADPALTLAAYVATISIITAAETVLPPTIEPTPEPVDLSALQQSISYDGIVDASIFIPAAGVQAPVMRVYLDGISWDVSNLGMNVGHLQGTNWMDAGTGNIVLSAHVEMRDGRPGIFARLHQLGVGDLILLRQADEERRYSVIEIRNVEPDDLTPLYPTATDQLTLITCDNYDFFGDVYRERTVVVAQRIG